MQQMIKEKALELLRSGAVSRVLGWKTGEFFYDLTPAVFDSVEEIENDFIYSGFSGANLSKYAIAQSRKEGKTAIFLKPCDSYSFQQLLKEHRILRDNMYVVGISCNGMLDMEKIRAAGCEGVTAVREEGDSLVVETLYGARTLDRNAFLLERCDVCKSKKVVVFDEMIGEQGSEQESDRFNRVAELEAMTSEERFAFWRQELSRCIRCNACRNVCPACSCEKCVFDNDKSGVRNKAAADPFEENLFHIIRAFHVAGRCTDCGECSRVCPQNIPLHLLNRKVISDINGFWGDYQAGEEADQRGPLVNFTFDDMEPSDRTKGGNA